MPEKLDLALENLSLINVTTNSACFKFNATAGTDVYEVSLNEANDESMEVDYEIQANDVYDIYSNCINNLAEG